MFSVYLLMERFLDLSSHYQTAKSVIFQKELYFFRGMFRICDMTYLTLLYQHSHDIPIRPKRPKPKNEKRVNVVGRFVYVKS